MNLLRASIVTALAMSATLSSAQGASPSIEERLRPDRIMFGTDNVAPPDQATQLRVFNLWDPIWAQLTLEARLKIRKGTYERVFDAARTRVRAGEAANTR